MSKTQIYFVVLLSAIVLFGCEKATEPQSEDGYFYVYSLTEGGKKICTDDVKGSFHREVDLYREVVQEPGVDLLRGFGHGGGYFWSLGLHIVMGYDVSSHIIVAIEKISPEGKITDILAPSEIANQDGSYCGIDYASGYLWIATEYYDQSGDMTIYVYKVDPTTFLTEELFSIHQDNPYYLTLESIAVEPKENAIWLALGYGGGINGFYKYDLFTGNYLGCVGAGSGDHPEMAISDNYFWLVDPLFWRINKSNGDCIYHGHLHYPAIGIALSMTLK